MHLRNTDRLTSLTLSSSSSSFYNLNFTFFEHKFQLRAKQYRILLFLSFDSDFSSFGSLFPGTAKSNSAFEENKRGRIEEINERVTSREKKQDRIFEHLCQFLQMGIQFLALVTLVTQFAGTVQAKVELAKQIWEYLNLFPEWLNYLKERDEKVETLKRKLEALSSVEEDIKEALKAAEVQPGKKRRREVETWLKNVQTKKEDVRKIEEKLREKKYLLLPWLEGSIARNLLEVKELYDKGQFSDGLFLDVHSTSKEPLLTQKLVGRDSDLKTILEWLNDPSVSIIGVYGVKGVGKTAILTHIQNGLTQNNSTFEHVYWVSVPERPSVWKLQDVIARQVGLSLSSEEDKIIRASKLHNALTKRGNCVIILDGVGRLFIEDVGIPNGKKGCKLILSTESLRLCLSMDCERTLEIKPLSDDEAGALFRQKLSSRNALPAEIDNIVEQIVQECQGLPLWIINVADRLRGVDDINEWRNALTEVTEYRKGLAD